MAKIPEYYNFGNEEKKGVSEEEEDLDKDKLLDILQDMYNTLAVAVNKKPDVYERATDGLSSDVRLSNGDININSSTGKVEMLIAHPTQTSVTWTSTAGGSGLYAYSLVNGSGTLLKGINLTSLRTSTGVFRMTFTTPLADTNYIVVVTPAVSDAASVWSVTLGTKTTANFVIKIKSLGDVFVNPTTFSVMVVN